MGFLSNLFGPEEKEPPPPQRNRAKTAKERKDIEQLRFLGKMKKLNPQAYDAWMAQRMGFPLQGAAPPLERDRLEDWKATTDLLKEAGLLNNPREDLADDNGWVRDLLTTLPSVIAAMRAGQAAPAPTPLPVTTAPPTQSLEASMSIISSYVIGQLNGKSPDEAARWLSTLPYSQAAELINAFRQVPDDQILVLLSDLAGKYPDFRGLVEWLRQRPEWLVQTIQALRRLSDRDEEAPKAVGHGL